MIGIIGSIPTLYTLYNRLTFTVRPTEATRTVTHAGSCIQGPSILTRPTTGWYRAKPARQFYNHGNFHKCEPVRQFYNKSWWLSTTVSQSDTHHHQLPVQYVEYSITPGTSPGLYVKNISDGHHVLKQCLAGFQLPSNVLTSAGSPTEAICTSTCTCSCVECPSILTCPSTGWKSKKTLPDLLMN